MFFVGKRISAIWIGLALVLGACHSSAPVKIQQTTAPLRTATVPSRAAGTPTSLPPGLPTLPRPTSTFHSADPAVWSEAIAEEPGTLDPALSYETIGGNILAQIYEPLIIYRSDNLSAFAPALAEPVPSREN
jgi:hypothetical protein